MIDCLFDSPVWKWTTQDHRQLYGNHDTHTSIHKLLPNGTIKEAGHIHITPPVQLFSFLLARGDKTITLRTAFSLLDAKGRLYVCLLEGNKEMPLFYWTPSNEPIWAKRMR